MRNTSTFTSWTNKKSFTIYHNLNCQSRYLIYLMECTLCKVQYVGKAEISFNISLNNNQSDDYNEIKTEVNTTVEGNGE